MNSTEGAALVLTSPAISEDLDDPFAFQNFIVENAETLFRYANSIRTLGPDESLYFITGCDKSESWAIAAYTDAMAPPNDVLRLQWGKTQYLWTCRGKAEARTGPSIATSENNDEGRGAHDQCLFLRGYCLAFSQRFRERMKRLPTPVLPQDFSGQISRPGSPSSSNRQSEQSSRSGTSSPSSPGSQIGIGCSSTMLYESPASETMNGVFVEFSIESFSPNVRPSSSPLFISFTIFLAQRASL
jgi:hypothetical protein